MNRTAWQTKHAQKHPVGPQPAAPGTLRHAVEIVQRQMIHAALQAAGGNVDAAARRLAVDRSNFYKLMKRLGITGMTRGRNRQHRRRESQR